MFIQFIFSLLLTDCWDIQKDKAVGEFQNWGKLYTVEFEIIVVKNSGSGWTNVFHFTTDGNCCNNGQRIPALWIHSTGHFHITSAVNGNGNYWKNFDFVLGKMHHITIKQYEVSGKYWYEIIIDGESKFKIENTQPQSFSSVKLYTSDPWHNSFSSDMGSICIDKIQNDEG